MPSLSLARNMFVALALIAILTFRPVPLSAKPDETNWLPLSKSELVKLTVGDLGEGVVRTESFEEKIADLRAKQGSNSADANTLLKMRDAELVSPSDTISFASNSVIPVWVTMAGNGERVHTIQISAPVVRFNKRQGDAVFAALSTLFVRLYPDWPGAKDWPTKSLGQAWNMHPFLRRAPLDDPDDLIAKTSLQGITSATFGVPPDIVVYAITVRERCIPSVKRADPFRRLVC